jgi:hypothetical protein
MEMTGRRRGNVQTSSDRRKLLQDFEQRLQDADAASVLRRPGSTAIVIHPTDDETELLKKLDWPPSRCEIVDAYWRYEESVYWVEVRGCRITDRPAGIYYRFDRRHRQDNFKLVLDKPTVSSHDLHLAFESLESLIKSGAVDNARATSEDRVIWLGSLPTSSPALEVIELTGHVESGKLVLDQPAPLPVAGNEIRVNDKRIVIQLREKAEA